MDLSNFSLLVSFLTHQLIFFLSANDNVPKAKIASHKIWLAQTLNTILLKITFQVQTELHSSLQS